VIGGFGEGILTTAAFNSSLRERDFGSGHVVVGTMTLPTFQLPAPNATNLYRNTIAYAAAHGGLLLTTDGVSSDNNARAAALLRQTATVDLATLANTPPETLAGYQAIWVNPSLSSANYTTLRTAVAPAGSLEQYVNAGGTLVLNVAGNSSSQNDIAPGGVDYDGNFTHQAENFTLPTYRYLTGATHNGGLLSPSDFDAWGSTDHGFLANLLPGVTVLSNAHGPSFVEYPYGAGRVILTTLTYGWGGGGAKGAPRDNLLFYAAGPRIVSGVPNITRIALGLFTLRAPGNPGDTLPLGPSIFFWVGVFDTGSDRVTLENDAAITLDFFNPSVPTFLDVRLWGLGAMSKLTLRAPLDFPQSETPAIDVLPLPPGTPSLFGGSVTNEVLAEIDYAQTIERDFLGGTIKSPAISYYEPGDPAIPTPLFWVDLDPSGGVSPGVTGHRYLFGDMRLSNGGSTETSATRNFLYDTGNTSTQITTSLATALGINLAAPPDDVVCLGAALPGCVGGDLLDGYIIDRVEIDGIGGTYQYAIDQPIVFVQPAGLGGLDANVGANFFDGNRVLFDGPGIRLGLDAVGPVGLPEPGGITALVAGAAFLAALRRRRMRSPDTAR